MLDITSMTIDELQTCITSATAELKRKREAAHFDGVSEIKRIAADIGVSVAFAQPRRVAKAKAPTGKGSKVAIKYRDPMNSDNKWSGRGLRPRWLAAAVSAGRDPDEFKVAA